MIQQRIQQLETLIAQADTAYHNGSEIMSDDEYDALKYELANLDPANLLLTKVGAEPNAEWTKEKHLIPLGSLNKVNYPEEMSRWLTNTLGKRQVVVVEKLDGLSLGLQYVDGKLVAACLRGNGLEGENILPNVLKMKGCVKKVPRFFGTIRAEIVLLKSDHQEHFPEYANPRNAASGICRRLDGDGCQHLTLMCYQVAGSYDDKDGLLDTEDKVFQWLDQQGFKTPNYKVCKTDIEVNQLWQDYQDVTRASLDYEIDGLVVSCNDSKVQQLLVGDDVLHPKGKVAFKFAKQFVKTTVREIVWGSGKSGRITPVCWVEPVLILGSTVEKASVYNSSYIQALQLDVGAEVLLCKAGEIIPRIEKVIKATGTVAPTPDTCPSCGGLTEMDGKHLVCPNVISCPARVLGCLQNWIKELNVLEWGESLLQKCIDSGKVQTVADLYTLTVEDLASLDRMGKKSAQKAWNILHANMNIPLEIFLGALSIPLIGQSTIKAIMGSGYETLHSIMEASAQQLEQVNGVGPTRAYNLAQGLEDNADMIEELLDNGITIKEKTMGTLTGKSVCITGKTNIKRAELHSMIENAGGTFKTSIVKGLSYLVMSDNSDGTSSKAVKAKSLDITIISENDLLEMIRDVK
jgi:DNA ligase (NAD+)